MSTMDSSDHQPISKEELGTELQSLLLRAYRNGIDVRGGFDCRNGGDHPDWDIVIMEMEKGD